MTCATGCFLNGQWLRARKLLQVVSCQGAQGLEAFLSPIGRGFFDKNVGATRLVVQSFQGYHERLVVVIVIGTRNQLVPRVVVIS